MEDRERIEVLERAVGLLAQQIEGLATQLLTATARGLALADLLRRAGIVSAEALAARMTAMHEGAEFAVEFGSAPEHEAFRRARRAMQERMDDESNDQT